MNMNLDDDGDARELNTLVQNYIMAEFVVVPPDFDYKSHLNMREQVGMFSIEEVDLTQIGIISSAVANSAVFSTMNNATLHPKSCFFFLQLLGEVGLVLNKIDNPFRRSQQEYEAFAKRWDDSHRGYVRGQEFERISFLIVNIVPLLDQNIINEAWEALGELKKYQDGINKTNYNFDKET